MPELKEVFDMVTKQTEPDLEAWREQEKRQRRANRNKKIGAYVVAAAIGVAAVAVVLGTRADLNRTKPEPGVNRIDATPEEDIATKFVGAYHALHADKAITFLADDADLSGLVGSLGSERIKGTAEELPLFMSWLEAAQYGRAFSRQGVTLSEPCEETSGSASGTAVRCPFHFHLLGSLGIGRDPYGGSFLDLTVRDGEIVRAAMSWDTDEFSLQMWEPFAEWVSSAHPDDAAVMYEDPTYNGVRLNEESILLWRDRIREYVNEIAFGDPLTADRNSRVVEGVEFSFTVPDAAWTAFGSTSINKSIVGPQGAEAMIFWTSHPDEDDARVDDADPCENLLAPTSPSLTAAGLAAAVSRAAGTELVSGPSAVTVGGYPAQHVVVTVREDLGCDPGYFYSWQTMWGGELWPETTVGDTIGVWIVDVGGTRLWFEAETNRQADAELEREIEQIIASIRFN